MMPNTKHHYQRVDLENGYLQATRDDTDEIQDFRINAYLKDGRLVRSERRLYNLQYDYFREQLWKNGVLIKDEISPGHGYGHLQWENVYGQSMGPDWDNPYPDNYEPVKPEGTKMFHEEGSILLSFCIELNIHFAINFYIWEDLQDWRKKGRDLITWVRPMDTWYSRVEEEEELEAQKNFDPKKAREERINVIERQNQYLRCEFESDKYLESIKANHEKDLDIEVPLDPRFIDIEVPLDPRFIGEPLNLIIVYPVIVNRQLTKSHEDISSPTPRVIEQNKELCPAKRPFNSPLCLGGIHDEKTTA